MDSDLKRWSDFKNGKIFPWDALSSIDEHQTLTRSK
jgi:hypothetical protein